MFSKASTIQVQQSEDACEGALRQWRDFAVNLILRHVPNNREFPFLCYRKQLRRVVGKGSLVCEFDDFLLSRNVETSFVKISLMSILVILNRRGARPMLPLI